MATPSTPDKFSAKSPQSSHQILSLIFDGEVFDELVTIHIGTGLDKRTFECSKGVLCFYSSYFHTAFNGRFREASEKTITLPTEDPLFFKVFREWTRTRCFYESTLEPSLLMDHATLAKLYIFADAHDIPLLQNVVADIVAHET